MKKKYSHIKYTTINERIIFCHNCSEILLFSENYFSLLFGERALQCKFLKTQFSKEARHNLQNFCRT